MEEDIISKIEADAKTIVPSDEPVDMKISSLDDDGEEETFQRVDWATFYNAWAGSPLIVIDESLDKIAASKGFEEGIIKTSKIVPAVAYPVYWYLAPYFASSGGIPEPFKPLVGALTVLLMQVGAMKMKKKAGREEGQANEGLPTP